jgi:hypothetical protein
MNHPISIKGVLLVNGCVLLVKNPRSQHPSTTSEPRFGKRQVEKSLWMTKERLILFARHAVIAI